MSDTLPIALGRNLRCGLGYDTHRLAEGRPLIIAGIELDSSRGPIAHSDGDVLCHAIVDAMLGAAALGDIGRHFPNSDPRWRNTPGLSFLLQTRNILEARGFRVINIDSTVILDEPKLAPYIAGIIERIAAALGLQASQISVKAKTSEGVTPDLAAAQAIVLVEQSAAQ